MTTAKRLEGRIALVTGAARGIGEAIATRLAAEGAAVMLIDIDGPEVEAVAARLPGATARQLDHTDREAVFATAADIDRRWGRLDILVNNAAILDQTRFDTLSPAHFNHVLDVNLTGSLQCTQAAAPLMRRHSWGRVVNIASLMGVRGSRDGIAYSTAKGAMVNLTRCLACELGPFGITVNAIAPGFIDTRMAILLDGSGHEHETDAFKDVYLKYGRLPVRRDGKPDDIAGPVFFLCSEDSRYVTGQVLLVDGGISATY